jgi:predicted nucleotidyltransferase
MNRPSTLDAARDRLAALLPELQERYAVRSLAIFGSFARGEQTPESDLDVLVDFDEAPGGLAFVGLANLLEERLGLPVDLATRPMIGGSLSAGVQADLVAV